MKGASANQPEDGARPAIRTSNSATSSRRRRGVVPVPSQRDIRDARSAAGGGGSGQPRANDYMENRTGNQTQPAIPMQSTFPVQWVPMQPGYPMQWVPVQPALPVQPGFPVQPNMIQQPRDSVQPTRPVQPAVRRQPVVYQPPTVSEEVEVPEESTAPEQPMIWEQPTVPEEPADSEQSMIAQPSEDRQQTNTWHNHIERSSFIQDTNPNNGGNFTGAEQHDLEQALSSSDWDQQDVDRLTRLLESDRILWDDLYPLLEPFLPEDARQRLGNMQLDSGAMPSLTQVEIETETVFWHERISIERRGAHANGPLDGGWGGIGSRGGYVGSERASSPSIEEVSSDRSDGPSWGGTPWGGDGGGGGGGSGSGDADIWSTNTPNAQDGETTFRGQSQALVRRAVAAFHAQQNQQGRSGNNGHRDQQQQHHRRRRRQADHHPSDRSGIQAQPNSHSHNHNHNHNNNNNNSNTNSNRHVHWGGSAGPTAGNDHNQANRGRNGGNHNRRVTNRPHDEDEFPDLFW